MLQTDVLLITFWVNDYKGGLVCRLYNVNLIPYGP